MVPRAAIASFIEKLKGRVHRRRRGKNRNDINIYVPDHSAAPAKGILRHSAGSKLHCSVSSSTQSPSERQHHGEATVCLSALELLQNEVLLCILDFCSPADRLCLALTCHSLHARLFDRPLSRLTPVNEHLLVRLERDLPHLYFCRSCDQLHPWQYHEPTTAALARRPRRQHRTRDGKLQASSYLDGQGCTAKKRYSPRFNKAYSLPFYLAHLAVKSRRLDPELSTPLRRLRFAAALSHESVRGNHSGRCILDITGRAKVIDNELYMAVSYVWHGDRPIAEDLRAFIDKTPLFVCCSLRTDAHADAKRRVVLTRGRRIPEMAAPSRQGSYFEACEDVGGSCESCLTDYAVSVACFPNQVGWVVALTTYQLFGRCRSPSDEKWKFMTGDSVPGPCRIEFNRAGSVKTKFRQAENV
ncbi:hypothetical protein JDV02_000753 [Purpureocillium takamizusanense]|uniref:F-box domain-containing protein n=1 Tax=Purpureocillium takamizusanense TaxID=2060973 RepID=A0A9Q8Q6T4_9HYPO|nr:uncharacterized protein JDV02_000753 [Purpureocillium takamizusanense]UNI14080.1 hypothetical protein JDV02_000753 [Purpureocillium takamizusanense]